MLYECLGHSASNGMEITTEAVKTLRERTGVSVMQCKYALEEAGGDIEKALALLRQKGSAIAKKKGDRTLAAGTVAAYVHNTRQVGALVELSSETDFVSKNAEFAALAYEIALQVAATDPLYVKREAASQGADASSILLEQEYIKDPSRTVQDLIDEAVQKFGERIEVARIARFSIK